MKESSLKNSILLRMVLVAALVILLFIPIVLVQFLVTDRQATHAAAVREVTRKWGGSQLLSGPVLSIPLQHAQGEEPGTAPRGTEILHLLPADLRVRGELFPEIRSRGIHRVVLYRAVITVEADFDTRSAETHRENHECLWDKAYLTVGISDMKGLRQIADAVIDGRTVRPQPGIRDRERIASGFTVDSLGLTAEGKCRTSLRLELNGSDQFTIVPAGRRTQLDLRGGWGDPSFAGDFLPETRDVTGDRFHAAWRVLDFNRNLRQSWIGVGPDLAAASFGVKLILPVDEYQKNSRALKYAIVLIALMFLAFLLIDVLAKSPFHPVHYGLVSFALILFYLLLLSLSEYTLFDTSYFIAGGAVVLLIGGYTRGVTKRWELTAVIASVLAALYAFLFVLLQLEDYALLLGSVGLLLVLAITMYITRKIDWFSLGTQQPPSPGSPAGGSPSS